MTILSVWLTIAGMAVTMILAYIETGKFGGTSFYGAVLFVPVLVLLMLLIKIKVPGRSKSVCTSRICDIGGYAI